jgi:uroporphyrinogen decarboxylase
MMTPRDNLLTALSHREPDRVPRDLGGRVTGITVGAYDALKELLGLQEQNEIIDYKQQLARPCEEALQRLGVDTRYVMPGSPQGWERHVAEDSTGYTYVDRWGIELRMPKEDGYYFDMVGHPLDGLTVEDLDSYPWPDPQDPGLTEGLREQAQMLSEQTDYALVGDPSTSLFERAWYLRGFQNFMIDLVTDESFATALLDRILELRMAGLESFLGEVGDYIHVIRLGDDLGQQGGPLIAPPLYRRLVKPRQRELIRFIKARTDAYVFYHTCGSVVEFVPDLIEIGVDILNPVQVSAKGMDPAQLKDRYGDRLCFWGGVDTQHVLPHGTPEEVRQEARRRIEQLAAGGGYVLNAVHNIQPDVPPENVLAMYAAADPD